MTTQTIVPKFGKYPPALYHSKNVDQAFYIASKTKFASIFLVHEPEMDVLFAPFFNMYAKDQQKIFYAHLFKANPLYEHLKQKKQMECRLVFQQTDMYISPTAYEEKNITHQVVPTWNYVSVQFKGVISFTHENNLQELLEKEVEIFESDVNSKWRLSDSPSNYVDTLTNYIFGVKVEVTDWKVHKKLNQTKGEKQFNNTMKWCEEQGKKEQSIVDWMNYFNPYKN